MDLKYYVVAAEVDLESQMHVELNGEEILLCRDGDEVFAVAYHCSHQEFTLEGGTIQHGCITCPYHGAEFDLRSGEALSAPAYEPIKIYPIKREDDTIAIGVPNLD